MGIRLTPRMGDEELDHSIKKCDGKSLADYYLAIMIDEKQMKSELFGLISGEVNIIKHDFRPGVNAKMKTRDVNRTLASAITELDKFISNEDKEQAPLEDNEYLRNLVLDIKDLIFKCDSPLRDFMGRDVTEFRDGAQDDCDDILMAIDLAEVNKSSVYLYLG